MTEVHVHLHINDDPQPVITDFGSQLLESEPQQAWATTVNPCPPIQFELLWERIGEIRTKQIEDLNADEKTRDKRQGWVAGMLQSIQILRDGAIADVKPELWEECQDRYPFPDQTSELGTLADYRDVKPLFIEARADLIPEEFNTHTHARTISPVEALADPELRHLVHVEDATGEEPDAVVSDAMWHQATGQVSDT